MLRNFSRKLSFFKKNLKNSIKKVIQWYNIMQSVNLIKISKKKTKKETKKETE